MTTALLDVAGLRNRSDRWRVLFVRYMRSIGADPDAVAAVISAETGGTFHPKMRNPDGAVGLIQWTTIGAESQGYEREQIARMSAEQQLRLVRDWYERAKPARLHRPIDYYLAVFAPAAIGKPDSAEVYSVANSPDAFEANAPLDIDGNGVITVAEVRFFFEPVMAAAQNKPRVIVVDERWPYLLAGLGAAAAASGGAYYLHNRKRAS